MAIVRWDPFRDAAALQDRINRIFNESFGVSRELDDDSGLYDWRPPVDIYETADGFTLKVELAGVAKEDVSVEVKDNVLILKGERLLDPAIKDEQYYRKERAFGKFQRSFTLQESIKPEQVKASFKNGILTITVPRPTEEKAKQITVNID
ncbi:MAG: Hsp20/alpha crystallin family protein [Desulfobacterales bacterium]|jgi:HSP20 family protein|nr:Hsp20/alpha crystallin family protein [Deltaproteobacteria bacterium]